MTPTSTVETLAAVHSERILAVAAAIARLCAAPVLLIGVLASPPPPGARWPVAVIVAVAMLETAGFAIAVLRRGTVGPASATVDVLVTAALLWPGAALVRAADPGTGSPAYNYMMIGVLAIGLARWPFWRCLPAAGLLAAVTLASSGDGLRRAMQDAVAPAGAVIVVSIIALLLRTAAAQLDSYRHEAVLRAGALAAERERVRQSEALRGTLLATLAEVAAGPAIADPAVRAQLRAEVGWLHEVVSSGLVSTPSALHPALRQLVAEKTAQRMRLDLVLPDEEPDLPLVAVEALVEATREALTNAAKHAGTLIATIRVSHVDGGVLVEVVDNGRGFDPADARIGVGIDSSIRARLREAGGHADIASAPGGGARIRLWVPA